MPAKQTHAEKKVVRTEQAKKKTMFGAAKTQKQLTTANYKFVLPKELEGVPGVDTLTVSLTTQLVETCFKQYGPAPWLYRELPRDGMPGKFDPVVNATGFAALFAEPAGMHPTKKISDFLTVAEPKHVIRRIVGEDDAKFDEVVEAITSLTPDKVLLIINNAWKLAADSGIAVPVFYYKELEGDLFVSPARYLDHKENIVEAQHRLKNKLTANRDWDVWPEHMAAYMELVAEKQRKDDELFAQFGEEDHCTDEGVAAALALLAVKPPPGAKPAV